MNALRWIGLLFGVVLLVVAAIVGGFIWGASVSPSPTPTVTPTPTPTRNAPGVYSWEQMLPGDCIADYSSAWQDRYTVVPCSSDHNAQMLVRAEVPGATVAYPGVKVLSPQVSKLCASPKNYDAKAAREYTQLGLFGAYPQTDAEWTAAPNYECFIAAPKGTVLTTDLMPKA